MFVSLGRIMTALVHRTRIIDMIYELLIVLVNKLIPFFVSKFRSKNIILNIEFILLYSSLLIFTYSIFQSTYYGDILLFSVCLILALFLFIYIYMLIILI